MVLFFFCTCRKRARTYNLFFFFSFFIYLPFFKDPGICRSFFIFISLPLSLFAFLGSLYNQVTSIYVCVSSCNREEWNLKKKAIGSSKEMEKNWKRNFRRSQILVVVGASCMLPSPNVYLDPRDHHREHLGQRWMEEESFVLLAPSSFSFSLSWTPREFSRQETPQFASWVRVANRLLWIGRIDRKNLVQFISINWRIRETVCTCINIVRMYDDVCMYI